MLLDNEEMKWVDIMKMIVNTQPDVIKIPKNPISKLAYRITIPEGKFDTFVMVCIILNMIQMAISFEDMTPAYSTSLDYINYFFTGVFAIECILKLIGNGFAYFNSTWNKFDFFVVGASFIDIVMS